ncbi:MAG: recombination regulator RecX [Oscillospiraceae bacterium]|jgi:regulatory protein|nr:recombination regulator RecX [Oscillospiraceae bacterium]
MRISEPDAAESESYEALWNRALWYLGRRDYGTLELRQKLLRQRPGKPLPAEDDVEQAIARLLELGYLNDERYAQRLAEALQAKGFGTRGVAMELRQRGLGDAYFDLPAEDGARLGELLEGKYRHKLVDERGRRSVFQALLRKGFAHGDIKKAIQDKIGG